MDELDILLAELEQTSVTDRGGNPDHPAPSEYDLLPEFASRNSPFPSSVNGKALPPQGPGGGSEASSAKPVQLQPVYKTCVGGAKSKDFTDDELNSDDHGYSTIQKGSRDTMGTMLSPTSAAKQLDDIMTNLAGLLSPTESTKTSLDPAPEIASKGAESSLDGMLGTLESDLQRLGVSTDAKGVCSSCKKCIVGTIVTAMGLTWHPEHFTCAHCKEEIGSKGFCERDGRAYCHEDYHNLFSPRCAYCRGPIRDKVLTALDKTWHPEHFFCVQCGDVFGNEGYHEKNGKAYCRKDYFNMFAPKCGSCDRPVLDNYLSALNNVWHPECFVCRDCLNPFLSGSFFEVGGMPYCELHYHQRQGSLCNGCQKPINGRCIAAMGMRFHPEHFVCAFCLKQLSQGVFKENKDKPYCNACYNKLFLLQ
ncbi:leupaxin-like [Scyliorhinus canicula]|uniref:leupaxin-like n=1 Tax=Scyliorhinus canicula TaxID=7830 RepID=UPI0018F59485|nr:leupaxin-like [Scyliorhinus canicula]